MHVFSLVVSHSWILQVLWVHCILYIWCKYLVTVHTVSFCMYTCIVLKVMVTPIIRTNFTPKTRVNFTLSKGVTVTPTNGASIVAAISLQFWSEHHYITLSFLQCAPGMGARGSLPRSPSVRGPPNSARLVQIRSGLSVTFQSSLIH